MNKISGILPSSARITAVDLKDSGSARPGSPAFGRKVGESNMQKNAVIRHAHRALKRHRELMDDRSDGQKEADIVRNMSDSFFNSRVQRDKSDAIVNAMLAEEMALAGTPPTVVAPEVAPRLDLDEILETESKSYNELNEDELSAPEVGRYVDVRA